MEAWKCGTCIRIVKAWSENRMPGKATKAGCLISRALNAEKKNYKVVKSIYAARNLRPWACYGKYFLQDHTFYLSNCQFNGIVTTYQYRGLPGSPSGLRKVFSSPVKRSLIQDNDQGLGKKRKDKRALETASVFFLAAYMILTQMCPHSQ